MVLKVRIVLEGLSEKEQGYLLNVGSWFAYYNFKVNMKTENSLRYSNCGLSNISSFKASAFKASAFKASASLWEFVISVFRKQAVPLFWLLPCRFIQTGQK